MSVSTAGGGWDVPVRIYAEKRLNDVQSEPQRVVDIILTWACPGEGGCGVRC